MLMGVNDLPVCSGVCCHLALTASWSIWHSILRGTKQSQCHGTDRGAVPGNYHPEVSDGKMEGGQKHHSLDTGAWPLATQGEAKHRKAVRLPVSGSQGRPQKTGEWHTGETQILTERGAQCTSTDCLALLLWSPSVSHQAFPNCLPCAE